MGAVIQERPDGKFYIIVNHGGRRTARYCGKGKAGAKAAKAAAAIIAGQLAAGDLKVFKKEPAAAPEPTFADCAKAWPEWHEKIFRKRRPNTQRNGAAAIRSFAAFKDLPISKVTSAVLQDYIAARRGVLADQTMRVYLTSAKGVLDYAVARGFIPVNPMRLGPLWRPEGGSEADPFSPEELNRILEAAAALSPALALMLRCWAQSGMRSGEIRGLRRSDLDLVRGEVRVERTLDHHGLFAEPKTKGSVRTASIIYPTCESVADWRPGCTTESRSVLAALAKIVPLNPDAPLFGSLKHPERHMRDTESLNLWDQVIQKSGVRRRHAENLRHSLVSGMLSRGCPPLMLTAQTGHSAQVMFRYYAAFISQTPPTATQAPPVGGEGWSSGYLGRAGDVSL